MSTKSSSSSKKNEKNHSGTIAVYDVQTDKEGNHNIKKLRNMSKKEIGELEAQRALQLLEEDKRKKEEEQKLFELKNEFKFFVNQLIESPSLMRPDIPLSESIFISVVQNIGIDLAKKLMSVTAINLAGETVEVPGYILEMYYNYLSDVKPGAVDSSTTDHSILLRAFISSNIPTKYDQLISEAFEKKMSRRIADIKSEAEKNSQITVPGVIKSFGLETSFFIGTVIKNILTAGDKNIDTLLADLEEAAEYLSLAINDIKEKTNLP